MKTTKKLIISTIVKELGIKPELYKEDNSYHWGGKEACLFSGSDIHVSTLNNPKFPLKDFVQDFRSKVEAVEKEMGSSIKSIVEGIDWVVGL